MARPSWPRKNKNMNKNDFEQLVNSLIGKSIKHVTYYEINYEDNKEYWNNNQEFDSLDFGLDLNMNNGECYGIIWGSEFYQYGISLLEHTLKNELSLYKNYDVSLKSNWKSFINKEIIDINIIWSWIKETDNSNELYYPQDLIITFNNNKKIYISALEIRDIDTVLYMMDNITVIFKEDIKNKYKVGE